MTGTTHDHRPLLAIFIGGFIAATIDILYAFVSNAAFGRGPVWVLQFVASGWLGKEAFKGGNTAAMIGLASHYAILFVAAAIYYAASRPWVALRRHAVAMGCAFGIAIYVVMNFVVWPNSAVPFKVPKHDTMRWIEGFASHALFVGVPIALAIRRWTRPRR